MLILSNDDVERLLTMEDCLAAMENAFRDLAEGNGINRPRSHTYVPRAPNVFYMFKSMDGALPRYGVQALRISSDMVQEVNGRREKLPVAPGGRYVGLVFLFSLDTCEPLAVIQDGYLQRMRVGATSGLAAKYLSRPESKVAGLLGTGWQAGAQVMALHAVRRLERIKVYSPNAHHRKEFAKEWTDKLGLPVEPVTSAREAVTGADIVACATNSLVPVLDGDWLAPGTHVNSVQGHELDRRTIERAAVIVVRAREEPTFWVMGNALPQEVSRRKTFGADDLRRVFELGEIVAGKVPGRTAADQITLFGGGGMGGSAGLGTQFAAVGAVVYQKAREAGVGREIPTEWFLETVHP